MMLSRTIFCTAVLLATLAVILLALFSPSPPGLDLSLYIQQPNNNNNIAGSNNAVAQPQPDGGGGAFIFHRMLTEGPRTLHGWWEKRRAS
ncbi:hypothetical protein ACFXTH_031425 [Malus domestica]